MIESYKTVRFDDINSLAIPHNELTELKIEKDNYSYFMKVNLNPNSGKLLIFSNGAVNPQKKQPPIYMRSSWSEDLTISTIFLDDPTLLGTDLKLGWGQGNKEVFHLEKISDIIIAFSKKMCCEENIFFYGSSAGGFMSAYLSLLTPKSTAIVNNPQTKVLNYLAPYVKRMLNHCYNVQNIEDTPEEIMYRLDLVRAFKHYEKMPEKLYYFQNYSCESDIDNHLKPFLNGLPNHYRENINVFPYFDKNRGHSPMPKDESIEAINKIISDDFIY